MVHYITIYYLPLLKCAGLHVLHSLPDFRLSTIPPAHVIDYSASATVDLKEQKSIMFGIKVANVNEYLKNLWWRAAAHIAEYGFGYNEGQHNYHLVEHKTSQLLLNSRDHGQFHLSFGPMQVQFLCKREAILYFDLCDVRLSLRDSHAIDHKRFALVITLWLTKY